MEFRFEFLINLANVTKICGAQFMVADRVCQSVFVSTNMDNGELIQTRCSTED